jgi:hypothetical protein
MESTGREAEPIAKGVWPALKQSFSDLFKWEQRVEIFNEYGEARYEWQRPTPLRNPISLMAQLSASNWLYFAVGLASWTADAFDFHALSIQTVKLAAYYDRTNTDISTAITLTLLLRSVGAALFGAAGDKVRFRGDRLERRWLTIKKYGRKWPMVLNMLVLGLLQIATIYAATFQQFLAVRSLFGLFMGGVYGNAIAMALENAPVEVCIVRHSCGFGLTIRRLGVSCPASYNKDIRWDMCLLLVQTWELEALSRVGRLFSVRFYCLLLIECLLMCFPVRINFISSPNEHFDTTNTTLVLYRKH